MTLQRQASGAVAWSLLNAFLSKFVALAIGIALARILGPESFGTFAVAMVALMALLSLNELGVSLAIVRWQGDPHAIAPTVTTISVATSVLLLAGGYLVAPSYASVMGSPAATPVVRLMLVSVLVNALVASPAAMMQRFFMQKQRMWADQVNVWVGAVLSLVLATAGMGAMSLAIGRVSGSVLSAVLFVILAPGGLRFGFDPGVVRPLLRFGLPLAGSSAIMFLAGYADQIVAGALLGPVQLGYYVLAFNLASWPVIMFSQPLRAVAPAAFARLQGDPPAMVGALRWIIGILAAVAFPVCFLFAGASHPIIDVVYGRQWAPAAPILAWLGVFAALRIVFELAYDYLVVLGRSRSIFVIQIVYLGALVPALLLGAGLAGSSGIAAAQVVVALVVILPLYLRQIAGSGLPTRAVLRRLAPAVLGGGMVWSAALVVSRMVDNPWAAGMLAGCVAVSVIVLLLVRDGSVVRRLREFRSVPSDAEPEPGS